MGAVQGLTSSGTFFSRDFGGVRRGNAERGRMGWEVGISL